MNPLFWASRNHFPGWPRSGTRWARHGAGRCRCTPSACGRCPRASYLQWEDRQLVAAAHLFVDEAFAAALGGFPDDLDVVVVTPAGQPTSVLKEAAQQEVGLLVLGAPASRWHHSRVVRGCTRAAACPVVVVPAPELARQWRRLPIRRMVAAIARDHGR